MTLNINKAKKVRKAGDKPASSFEPAIERAVVQTSAEAIAEAKSKGDMASATVLAFANTKPLDPGWKAITDSVMGKDIGCVTCHCRTDLRLVLRDRGVSPGYACFVLGCALCKDQIEHHVNVAALSRAAPTAFMKTVAETLDGTFKTAGWVHWPERDSRQHAVRLVAADFNALMSTVDKRMGHVHRGVGMRALDWSGCAVLTSPHAKPVMTLAGSADVLLTAIENLMTPCSHCGARTRIDCDYTCTRAPGAIEAALVWRWRPAV